MEDERMVAGTIPPVYVSGVAHAPKGAWPLALSGCYDQDGDHLKIYVEAAKSEETFADYINTQILITELTA